MEEGVTLMGAASGETDEPYEFISAEPTRHNKLLVPFR